MGLIFVLRNQNGSYTELNCWVAPLPMHLSRFVLDLAKGDIVADLEFVKKFTRPNFRAEKFYTLKMRKLRLFSPAINSENASLSVIWASFG